MDATPVCPIPAIDWRTVRHEEIIHLAQHGVIATDVSADHHIRNENEMRRRRRHRLRRMAHEASEELARAVAEWRSQSFRHPDPQAVAVLAAETARSRGWWAERYECSLSCGDLGERGAADSCSDEGECGAQESSLGCSDVDGSGRENGPGETGVSGSGAQPRSSEQAPCSPSGASSGALGASSGASPGASSGASCRRGHGRVVSVGALPELCPFPPVDWRSLLPAAPAAPSHCQAPCCTAPLSVATSPAFSAISPSSVTPSPSLSLSTFGSSPLSVSRPRFLPSLTARLGVRPLLPRQHSSASPTEVHQGQWGPWQRLLHSSRCLPLCYSPLPIQ
ncbi:hypothetical protein CLOM_g10277 [Closterium sp. NIES-68]|nr:hypothetical protein CLOM_g10277 [Closterium sp. NIES-68]